jgi:CRP-like cAMP-binding protein
MISIMKLPFPFDTLPASARRRVDLDRSETLFHQGAATRGMFYLVSGAMILRRHTKSGHPIVIHTAHSGSTFAEASLFSETYHCDAVATAPASLLCFDRAAVRGIMESDAGFALALSLRFAQDLQAARRRYEVLSIKGAQERVFAALLAFGQEGTATAFADRIGLSPEATYRALSALVRKGRVIRESRGRYALAD